MDSIFSIDFSSSTSPKELAYFLGFFWADGYNILKNSHCVIEIIEEDMLNIQHIFEKVYHFAYYKRERINRKPQMSLSFSDKGISEFLRTYGKYPNTTESHEKIMKYIPEEYLVYFIRGLFDGDGCFYATEKTNQVYISGNYNQDWGYLLDFLKKKGFSFKGHKAGKKNKYSFIRCTEKKSIDNFIQWLYANDDEIFLERKKEKASKILLNEFGKIRKNTEQKKNDKIFSILENNNKLGRNEISDLAGFCCRHILDKLVEEGKVKQEKLPNRKVYFFLPEKKK